MVGEKNLKTKFFSLVEHKLAKLRRKKASEKKQRRLDEIRKYIFLKKWVKWPIGNAMAKKLIDCGFESHRGKTFLPHIKISSGLEDTRKNVENCPDHFGTIVLSAMGRWAWVFHIRLLERMSTKRAGYKTRIM